MAMRGHRDQLHFFLACCLHDLAGRIPFEQQALNGDPIGLLPQRLVQVLLRPFDDFRMQTAGEFVPKLDHSDWIAH